MQDPRRLFLRSGLAAAAALAAGPVFAGALTFEGPVIIEPAGTLTAGTFPLFTYTGSLTGTPAWSE